MDLKEWTRIFIKQRDLIKREIATIEELPDGFMLHLHAGGQRLVIVEERLQATDKQPSMIVCKNTVANVQELVKEWKQFTIDPALTIVFAHPVTNEKWLVKPHLHNKIADNESLEMGLIAMQQSISGT